MSGPSLVGRMARQSLLQHRRHSKTDQRCRSPGVRIASTRRRIRQRSSCLRSCVSGSAGVTGPWTLTFPADLAAQLQAHLFPGDSDEHGAVVGAAVARTPHGIRLLARDILIAEDGVSYVEGWRSHRTLSAAFVREAILHCREQGLVYLAVHNHGGSDRAGFYQ